LQPVEVDPPPGLVPGDDPVAAAVEARALAVRDVDVERDLARDRIVVAAPGDVAEVRLAEALGEVRGGRIGGIARPRPVVAAQQFGVEAPGRLRGNGGWGRLHGREYPQAPASSP